MIEEIATQALEWAVANSSPVAVLVMLGVGVILMFCELFIEATPSEEDDAKWARIKSGYAGPAINFMISWARSKFLKR